MGKNNRDYKIKDKNLTKNKKNAKLNKSIAFTLAGMAAIGAGATLSGQNQDAQAMMGKVGSIATKAVKSATTKMPMVTSKVTSSIGTKVATSRVLNGAPGAINSGRVGSNGTQFAGLPKTSTTTSTLNKTTTTTPKSPTTTTTTTGSLTSTSSKGTPKLSNVGSLGSKTDPFKGGNASSVTLKNGDLNQKAYNQQKNTGGPTFTTEGFYRK